MRAWAAPRKGERLEPIELETAALREGELRVAVEACGICHSDIHLIDNDWGVSEYPLVPGHEIVGRVVERGRAVPDSHAEGTVVGVGWQRGACGRCDDCVSGRDNLCEESQATCVSHAGGYAERHVTDWRYAFPMPEALRCPEAAPLLCGGITVYSPLRHFLARAAGRVGVVGLGGLGHLAVKLARALGCEVTVFSSSESKRAEAEAMGASRFVGSTEKKAIAASGARLDLVIVTANVTLPWEGYLSTLRTDGTLCFVGVPPENLSFGVGHLLGRRRRVAASPIGSRSEIAEMLELAARHDILATVERYPFARVNDAIERARKNQVRYRAVLSGF